MWRSSRTDGSPAGKQQAKATSKQSTKISFVTPANRTHGFVIGHVVPEAVSNGPIAYLQDGDIITINADKNTLEHHVPTAEFKQRERAWPDRRVHGGWLAAYQALCAPASRGCVLDGTRDRRGDEGRVRKQEGEKKERAKENSGSRRREKDSKQKGERPSLVSRLSSRNGLVGEELEELKMELEAARLKHLEK